MKTFIGPPHLDSAGVPVHDICCHHCKGTGKLDAQSACECCDGTGVLVDDCCTCDGCRALCDEVGICFDCGVGCEPVVCDQCGLDAFRCQVYRTGADSHVGEADLCRDSVACEARYDEANKRPRAAQ